MTDITLRVFLALYKRKKTTCKELADICECSTRTILRALDSITPLCPLILERGHNGGVALPEDYKL